MFGKAEAASSLASMKTSGCCVMFGNLPFAWRACEAAPDGSLNPLSRGDARPESYQSLFKRKLKKLLVSVGLSYKII